MLRPLLLLALAACSDKPAVDSDAPTDADADGYPASTDCADDNPNIHPDATEACDGLDNNCDGSTDEGVLNTYYTDTDNDSYGDSPITACTQPEGSATQPGDCDDSSSETYPGAGERCDSLDNDCDGDTDEALSSTWYPDQDGDSHGDPSTPIESCDPGPGFVATGLDCDDGRDDIHPNAPEICDNTDNNCDGTIDEAVQTTYYEDQDGDGYGDPDASTLACSAPSGFVTNAEDCDDSDSTLNPDTPWYLDDDGDGYGDSTSSFTQCEQPSGAVADSTDCDDTLATTHPGASEFCDKSDNDCDGDIDEADAVDAVLYYSDSDGDSFGDPSTATRSCAAPTGSVTDSTDCDDSQASTYPGATETCDSVDSDCDGSLDDPEASDAVVYYADSDGDGRGDPSSSSRACSTPSGYVSDSSDCEDGVATAYPGSTSTETPLDGIDTDCDGNDYCTDLNCDGLPDLAVAQAYSGSSFQGSLYLYMNTGSGYSTSSVTTLTVYASYMVLADDLNGDGYQDIVAANYRSDSSLSINSFVYWGSSSGYSSSNRTDLPTIGTFSVAIADFNNDGYKDLVFANYYNSTYSLNSYVYYGSSSGYSTSSRSSLATVGAAIVKTEDFNNDGYEDILFGCTYSGSSYTTNSVLWWGSSSGFSSSNVTNLPTIGADDIELGDFNKDGYTDIAFANYYTGATYTLSSYVYYGSSSGYSTSSRTSLNTVGANSVASGDVNGDGYTDLAFTGYYSGVWTGSAPVRVYFGSSSGYSSSNYDDVNTRGALAVEVEDLDSDGYDDVIAAVYYSGTTHITTSAVYWGSSSGVSSSDKTSLSLTGPSDVGVGDTNGDGHPELIFAGYYGGSWSTAAYTTVLTGSSSGYGSSSTALASKGVYAKPLLVGNTDW